MFQSAKKSPLANTLQVMLLIYMTQLYPMKFQSAKKSPLANTLAADLAADKAARIAKAEAFQSAKKSPLANTKKNLKLSYTKMQKL